MYEEFLSKVSILGKSVYVYVDHSVCRNMVKHDCVCKCVPCYALIFGTRSESRVQAVKSDEYNILYTVD